MEARAKTINHLEQLIRPSKDELTACDVFGAELPNHFHQHRQGDWFVEKMIGLPTNLRLLTDTRRKADDGGRIRWCLQGDGG